MLHWSKPNPSHPLKASVKRQYPGKKKLYLAEVCVHSTGPGPPGPSKPSLLPVAGQDTCHRVTRLLGPSLCAPKAQSSCGQP